MLSRYRSVLGQTLPRNSPAARTNNPVQQFEDAAPFRLQQLLARNNFTSLLPEQLLPTSFKLWDGPLAGIAHVAGQFTALEEGPEGEVTELPTEELARSLSADLDLLISLAEITQYIMYDAGGSESDFSVVPIILEPRPQAAPAAAIASAQSAGVPNYSTDVSPGALTDAVQYGGGGTADTAIGVGGGTEEGGGGGSRWWSSSAVRDVALGWSEVAASLGVAPEVAAQLQPVLQLDSRELFLSHMYERHIRKLEGGEHITEQEVLGLSTDSRVLDTPSDTACTSTSNGARLAHLPPLAARALAPSSPLAGLASFRDDAPPPLPYTSASALAAAARSFSEAVRYPVLQCMVGSEELGWNPIPLLWLGRSQRSGVIVGLMTAVVWT